mgnify:FL=1
MTAIDESEYNQFLIIERERIDFLNDKPFKSRPKQRTKINDSIADEDDIGEQS